MRINTLADHNLFCAMNYAESMKPSKFKRQTKPNTQDCKLYACYCLHVDKCCEY